MNKYITCLLALILGVGFTFGAENKLPVKVAKYEKLPRFVEPTNYHTDIEDGNSQPVIHHSMNRDNSYWSTLVDSSTNGYGMVLGSTRPIYIDEDNGWFFVFRQWAGENTTHGQLGAAYSENGMDWTNYNYLNVGFDWPPSNRQARYPSALGNPDYPYAFWNEYTTLSGSYGGRPFYTYDEFGWDGGSFAAPIDVDLQWGGGTDQWVGSPGTSFDGDNAIVNVAYNDWTRNNYFMFHSEAYDDGYLVFGEEFVIIDEPAYLEPGDASGSYNSSPAVSMTPDGMGAVGLVGLFAGGLDDNSSVSNNHTFIFKMTEDHGASWHGPSSSEPPYYNDDVYFIPDNVFDHMQNTYFSDYYDPCADTTSAITSFWSYYEFDMKLDSEGNPHIMMEILPCDDSFCYYFSGDYSEVGAGYYHFTIDRDNLDNPGFVNTPTGWNYSKVMTGSATWYVGDPTGNSYIWSTQAQLSFDPEDPNLVWVVSDMGIRGPVEDYDPEDPDDCEEPYIWYPQWSADILIFKSTDNGATWWNPLNASNTPDETDWAGGEECDTPSGWCSPEEQFPHTAQWATSDAVNYVFQMPDWYFNEIGDMLGADHKNRVYGGSAEFTENSEPEYPGDWFSGGDVDVSISNQANWNLVGLPVGTEDNSYSQVFPNSISNTLYAFDAGYVSAENLELGEGYWLRFDAEGENMVTGGSVSEIPVTLAAGWNLISGGSESMGVGTISDPDGIVVANTLYGFGTGYESSTELVPGQGYWIRTTATGDVVIGGAAARSGEFVNRLKNASSILFNGKALYFDAVVPEAEKLSYSLPPVPPTGAFDVRYSDNLIYTGSTGNITVMNPYGELNVSYHIADNSKWILTSATGDIFELSGSGQFLIPNTVNAEFTLIKSEISIEPVMFGLQGSYPNPFNPSTTINYSVETEGLTSLIVYDMMGREIKSLVSGYLTPNHYSVVWNGKDNADRQVPSGIYLYRLTSGEFTDMKKVMLMK